ncbi:hypothetical protein Pan189_21190 [Stratiformator vulcanicus]|uniref:Uncharacterized protein n=1 Tax=Stratiformator vulcanicus TaxID=2527980 RepID=A0A517R1H2_9PLAN|nr:hypothetical protein Pan189_21190 [Stratiformator vulcanicus]
MPDPELTDLLWTVAPTSLLWFFCAVITTPLLWQLVRLAWRDVRDDRRDRLRVVALTGFCVALMVAMLVLMSCPLALISLTYLYPLTLSPHSIYFRLFVASFVIWQLSFTWIIFLGGRNVRQLWQQYRRAVMDRKRLRPILIYGRLFRIRIRTCLRSMDRKLW